MQVAEQHASHELAQHRRLAGTRGQVAAEFRAGEDHHQSQEYDRYVRMTHN
jgi:hypothetical protein